MQRPIEKYGWKYTGTYNSDDGLEECFETILGYEVRINNEGNILFLSEEVGFGFELLQAIYETAKQIKDENKNEM